jgi:primosomal protein N' (replication factor Y) (superfamily II helicase)
LGRTFDYLVPPEWSDIVSVGTLVRIGLHGRSVGGWVVAVGVEPPPGVRPVPLSKVSSVGPPADMVDLTDWAAWRWAGRRTAFLRAASPPHAVRTLPPPFAAAEPVTSPASDDDHRVAVEALAAGQAVVRLAPAQDHHPLLMAAAARGPVLVVTPTIDGAGAVARRLRRSGVPVATLPAGWDQAAAGGCAVAGARGAAWAPVPGLAAVMVVEAHDETLVDERAPTWSAWVVAAERAQRAGVPCLLVTACPTLEQLAWGRLVVPARSAERAGWPVVDVVDRRGDDPRTGLFGSRLVDAVRGATTERRVVCVLNRKGRARLLACAACRELVVCERCRAAMSSVEDGELCCRNCDSRRPAVCDSCGSGRLKVLRTGVSRVREELEALAGQTVGEMTADGTVDGEAAVVVGTEAVLHRMSGAAAVAFLDFDQELLAPRYRAGEQAMALLVRAARVAGRRESGGRVLVQTRQPGHPVLVAAVRADPGRLVEAEQEIRRVLALPPVCAVALLSGEAASPFAAALRPRVEVLDLGDGRWLARASDHEGLCDALAATARPRGRLRVEVDPLRL